MAVVSIVIRDNSLWIEADGTHKAIAVATFDSGSPDLEEAIERADADAWQALLDGIDAGNFDARAEKRAGERDAVTATLYREPILGQFLEATEDQKAEHRIRECMTVEDLLLANEYLTDAFDFKAAKGWTNNQFRNYLRDTLGASDSQIARFEDFAQYMTPARVDDLTAAQAVYDGDPR